MQYSNTANGTINKMIKGADGSTRFYTARKMGAANVALEGFKLLKAITPSLGAGADALKANSDREEQFEDGQAHTFGAMLQLLSENISDEHFMSLVEKVTGSLYLGDEPIKDIWAHFDEFEGDFMDVLIWLVRENFTNFIMGSGTVVSLIEKITSLMSPQMIAAVDNFKKTLETAPNEQ